MPRMSAIDRAYATERANLEGVLPVPNESYAQTSRLARGGRKLTYKLKVLQQPQRARACGAGAKSSADRRPVDPPPIVELRIYEGEHEERDITFQLSANYFLFATLEPARPVAQGRVPQDTSRSAVLTGTPVSGMVYLDRPEPAGYFLFPDLSVRHEGFFRLNFSLYEELKDPNDGDNDERDGESPGFCQGQVTHRLEIKSTPFTVWSAKKFPGLTQSTLLSRAIADQGCRVRIRGETRMRKRGKGGKNGQNEPSEDGHDHSNTPDMYQQQHFSDGHSMVDSSGRERTASIASSHALYGVPDSRRSSLQEMPQAYSQALYPPPPPATQNGQSGTGTQNQYGGAPPPPGQHYSGYMYQQPMPAPMPYQGYQYAPPMHSNQHQGTHFPGAPPPPHSVSQYTESPMHSNQHQGTHFPGAPPPPHTVSQYQQVPPPPHQVSHYEPQGHMRHGSSDYAGSNSTDSRCSSAMGPPAPAPYGYGQQNQSMSQQYSSHNSGYSMAPTTTRESVHLPTMNTHNGMSMAGHVLPPINTTSQTRDRAEPVTPSVPVSPSYGNYGSVLLRQQVAESSSRSGSKRGYDSVFGTPAVHEPLRQGARPSQLPYANASAGLITQDADGVLSMVYRRADGREISRPLPTVI